MFSSNSAKVLFVLLFAAMSFSGCDFQPKTEGETPVPPDSAIEELKSDIPFSNKEPGNFQAEFIVTTNGAVDKTFAAREGGKSLLNYNFGEKNQFSVVKTADGKTFQILPAKKIYAEISSESGVLSAENPFDFLTTEWLNQKADAKFEKLGAENDLTKYRAVFDENGKAEVLIWIDEKIGLPVKQEFYSIGGEQKTLNFTFEMKNFQPQTESGLFEIPKNFQKVTIEEFRRVLKSEN